MTVFAHGLGASIAETRPLGSGVAGTRVFLHFPGHGASAPHPASAEAGGYAALAGDLLRVADHVGASRALGVSMGAGALLHLLAAHPQRFERVVLFLPAALDAHRDDLGVRRMRALATLIDASDIPGLEHHLLEDLPPSVHSVPGVSAYVAGKARALAGSPVAALLRSLALDRPVANRAKLSGVRVPTLVIGQQGDPVHPADTAREVAAALPEARLEMFEADAVWTARRRLREVVAGFLAE